MCVYIEDKFEFFKQAFESTYLFQKLKPSEVVIVFDGPVKSVIKNYINSFNDKNIKVVKLVDNKGLGCALRIGVNECSNEIIARMDSDDISHIDRFKIQIPYFINNKLDVCGTSMEEFINNSDPYGSIVSLKKMPKSHSKCLSLTKISSPVNHPTVVFRKSKVLNAGNYNNSFFKEDIDLWIRMISQGARFGNITTPLLLFRYTNTLKKRKGLKYMLNELIIIKKKYDNSIINSLEFILISFCSIIIRMQPEFVLRKIYSIYRKRFNN
jgi:glycosyltransferase involved in cell wall biosynthesis